MRSILLALACVLTHTALGSELVKVSCNVDGQELLIEHRLGDGTAKYSVAKEDGKVLVSGEFKTVVAEESSFLKLVVLGFQNEDGAVVLGLRDVKTMDQLVPGVYEAKADLTVDWSTGSIDGSTVDCSVTVEN